MFNLHFSSSCKDNQKLIDTIVGLEIKIKSLTSSHKYTLKNVRKECNEEIDAITAKHSKELSERYGTLTYDKNTACKDRDHYKQKYQEISSSYSNIAAELAHINQFIIRSGEAIGSGNEYILDTKYILGMQKQIDELKKMVALLTPKPKRKYTTRIKVPNALIPLGKQEVLPRVFTEWASSEELASYPKGQTHILENGFYNKGQS